MGGGNDGWGYPHAPSKGLAAPLHSPRKEAPSYATVSVRGNDGMGGGNGGRRLAEPL